MQPVHMVCSLKDDGGYVPVIHLVFRDGYADDTLFMRLSDVKLNKFFMVAKPDRSLGFDIAAFMYFI